MQADERPPALSFGFRAEDLSFDSPDGRYAGEGLQLAAQGTLRPADELAVKLEGAIAEGELLFGDFYRNFADASLKFAGSGRRASSGFEFSRIHLDDGGAFALEATRPGLGGVVMSRSGRLRSTACNCLSQRPTGAISSRWPLLGRSMGWK